MSVLMLPADENVAVANDCAAGNANADATHPDDSIGAGGHTYLQVVTCNRYALLNSFDCNVDVNAKIANANNSFDCNVDVNAKIANAHINFIFVGDSLGRFIWPPPQINFSCKWKHMLSLDLNHRPLW